CRHGRQHIHARRQPFLPQRAGERRRITAPWKRRQHDNRVGGHENLTSNAKINLSTRDRDALLSHVACLRFGTSLRRLPRPDRPVLPVATHFSTCSCSWAACWSSMRWSATKDCSP